MKKSCKFLLLVVLIAVFGTVYVQRISEWEKGLTGNFIVYGQAGTNPNPPVQQGPVVRAISELTVGTISNIAYSTNIQVVNSGNTAVTVLGSFFNGDGTPFSVPMTETSPPGSALTFTGNFPLVNLPAKSVLTITANSPSSPAITGWGLIATSASVTIDTRIDLTNSVTGNLISRTGLQTSAPDMQRFVIPRHSATSLSQAGGLLNLVYTRDLEFAVMNTDGSAAVLNGTLFSSAGAILATQTVTMNPHTRIVASAHDFFDLDVPSDTETYIVFDAVSPVWAATAQTVEGPSAANVAVDKIQ